MFGTPFMALAHTSMFKKKIAWTNLREKNENDKMSEHKPEKRDEERRRSSRRHDDGEICLTPSENEKLREWGYTLGKKLSQGVSAKIYLTELLSGEQPEIKRACKVIDKKTTETKFVTKFLPREIAILSTLKSPHCIQVFSILEIKSKCFVFMRLAEKGDLLNYLTEYGPVEEDHARMWIRQLMLAVKYLHSKKIAHRDIKCENILITANSNAKLGDFGFSRYWVDNSGHDTLSQTYCGSITYAAPEILIGRPYVPKYCDMWSMGVVFFIMTNLKKPFSKNKAAPLLKEQLAKNYTFSTKTRVQLSNEAKQIIRRMLEPEVKLRATPDTVLYSKWMLKDQLLITLVPDDISPCDDEVKKRPSGIHLDAISSGPKSNQPGTTKN